MVNKVILVGRASADPELRSTGAGTPVANLRLVTNSYSGKDAEGTRKEHTEFHALVIFGRLAEIAGEYVRKGRLLYVEGRLQTRSWTGQDGQTRYATEVVVDNLQLLSPKGAEAAAAA
jgi:single-strand DNA-binding protein